MGRKARLETEITGDEGPFVNAIRRAEKEAESFSGRASRKLTQVFKRSPNMRAERAFSGLFQDLASGNVASGIEAISSRMTGLGLIAGVAIGAGVAIFTKFKEQIDATREAFSQLEGEMIKKPTSTVTKLSSEGMQQALESRQKLAEEARKKQSSSFGSELLAAGKSMFPFQFGKNEDAERIRNQGLLNQEYTESKEIMEAQVDLMQRMNQLQRMEADGDEHSVRIDKMILETRQAQAELRTRGLPAAQFKRANEGLEETLTARIDAENKAHAKLNDTKDRGFEVSKRQIDLERSSLTPEQKKALSSAIDLSSINTGLANPNLTTDERRNLILQKMKKEGDLGIMPGTVAPFSGEWNNRRGAGESLNASEALGKVGLNPSDISKYTGGLPGDAEKTGSPDVVAEIAKLNATMEKAWPSQ